ncbi:MAG: CapA family protein [Bacilli bacterium]|nr:CapA family protein [Bacilli bacterium]
MKKKWIIVSLLFLIILSLGVLIFYFRKEYIKVKVNNSSPLFIYKNNLADKIENNLHKIKKLLDEFELQTNITITAVGDCTIGYDDAFGYTNSFNHEYDKNGVDYFFGGVKNIFEKDDITVVNLESTFTNSNEKREKKFNFKAPTSYVEILNRGDIEVVNLANNHSHDYGDVGYQDTLDTLNSADVNYFGNSDYYIYEKNDIKIGFAGIFCIGYRCTKLVDKAITNLKSYDVDAIVLSIHWGIEYDYQQSSIQEYVGRYAIEQGADLIVGHHPHVLQGIEKYKGKYIVYSLANFSFGGNKNPADKDTMIFQIRFTFKDGNIVDDTIKIYPASVSSTSKRNDYRPTLLTGVDATRVLEKIQRYSTGINLDETFK